MAYLIDSDWVIDYIAMVPEGLTLVERLSDEGIYISVITYMEVYEGLGRSHDPSTYEESLGEIPLLSVTLGIARRCAKLRGELRDQGKRVNQRSLDLLIATTALEHGLTLVTRNVADFRDVSGLQLKAS